MKKSIFVVLLLSLGFLIGCTKKSDDTIKIGLAGPMSGPDGHVGETYLHGAQTAIDEWNDHGGVLSKKITPIVRDDEGKPEKAATVAQDLVDNQVSAILGHLNSGCTIPASVIYDRAGIPEITLSSNTQVTDRGMKRMFRICWRDDQQAAMDAQFMRDKLKLSKVAILHNKSAYGEGLVADLKKFFTAAGGEVVLYQGVAKEELDFRTQIALIKSSGADGIFWGGFYDQSGPFVSQLRQQGVNLPFVGGDANIDQNFINTTGSNVSGVYFSGAIDSQHLPAAQSFLERYRKKYGAEGPYSIYGYASASILLQAIQKAGSVEPEKIAQVMHSQAFDTAIGPVVYDDRGDIKNAALDIWSVNNGAFTAIH